ncbi:hypothetical protein DL767_008241 [Monosporascus sp. MG133]|nr:hypothetical protein DL767_008241 [Monosporascus sp. MG133]
MADAITEATAKLVLDEVTGEMKRAKKAAADKAKAAAPAQPKENAPKPKEKTEEPTIDPDAMFKQGFLEDVYKERPVKPVVTRFPPEPNGFLHIGHSKAIAVNFGFAKYHGGQCYLRYDDTNPEAEEEKYFVAIEEMVRWLGFSPAKITYSSDNFQRLYDMAEKLIELGKAYVCHCNGVYEPMQREYGRLSLTGTVLSKRKILKLVSEGIVRDWDDPRLFTLIAIKRRGVPPGAILEFVNELGVTTAPSVIQMKRFDQSIRRYLERTVPRLMLVLDPLPVVIEGAEELELDVPFSPKVPEMGSHKVKFTPTVYIDRSDFREVDSKDYFRLAPEKSVGLYQVPYPIKAVSFSKDEVTGKVTEVRAVFDKEGKKPKTYIQWVASGSREVEVRIHNSLFKSEKPEDAEGGFLNDLNPESEVIYPNALVESAGYDEVRRRAPWPEAAGESELGKGGPESVRFQAMRIAYFAADSDSTDEKVVLNRIVSLKEDAGKS